MKFPFKSAFRKVDHYYSRKYFSPLPPNWVNEFYIFHNIDWPFKNFKTDFLNSDIRDLFGIYNKRMEEHEYIIHYKNNCIIEPQFGWAIVNSNNFFRESIPYSLNDNIIYPSYLRKKYFKRNYFKLDVAISLQYRWDNYWHFFNDILGQLTLLDKYKVPNETPIVIPKRAYKFKYFTDALKRSEYLKSKNWVALGEWDYLEVKEAYFAKNMPNVREHFDEIVKFLNVPFPNRTASRKIFIKRNNTRPRRIKNSKEIEAVATSMGFEIIDNDSLNLDEQIQLYSQSDVICGIHGAGLTNMIFRKGAPCSIFEIFPANYIMPNYYWLAQSFGYFYNGICGENEQSDKSFYLDPQKFREKLEHFLKTSLSEIHYTDFEGTV